MKPTLARWLVYAVLSLSFSSIMLMNGTGVYASSPGYAPRIGGIVAGFKLAGLEPDGDPLDQVVLQTQLAPSNGMPSMHLIVDSYLENFRPDTTPILPDLLNPRVTATNLGGFLQGKVLLTDDAGKVLALGSFLAEAFINNSSNHAVMRLYGSGEGYGGKGALKGSFILHRDATLAGRLTGKLILPAAAFRQIAQNRNPRVVYFPRALLKSIISTVTVVPAPMMGKSATGTSGAPLHTGYGKPTVGRYAARAAAPHSSSRRLSLVTLTAFAGAILSFLCAIFFWWKGRTTPAST